MSGRRVVIVGGGYAGVMVANRLLSSLTLPEKNDIHVSVVNARERFVERIRLHELVAGTRTDVSLPMDGILHPDAHLIVGSASMIDRARNLLHVDTASGPQELAYDELVLAVGSRGADQVPGAVEHAVFVADPERAVLAAAAVAAVSPGGEVVVVGGGPTGVETASEIAATNPLVRVSLLTGSGLLPGFGQRARRAVRSELRRAGITLIENERVREVREGELEYVSGRSSPFDACVWAAAFEVPDLAKTSGLTVDTLGRLRVNEDLTSLDAANIVGAGDCVVLPAANGAHLRMGCAVALPLGGHAAETVLHHLRSTPSAPASVGFLVQCLSLGRKRGVIQFVHADDSPRGLHLSGRLGAWFKEFICRMTLSGPAEERIRPGAYKAPAGPTRQEPKSA